MSQSRHHDFLTIPNMLSLFRIALVGIFIYNFIKDKLTFDWVSLAILVISALSDMLDGSIARKYNQVSNWGKVLDPAADKLFTISTVICLYFGKLIPIWLVIIVLVKEVFMLVGGSVLYKVTRAVIPSRWYGKLTTVLFYATFCLAVFLNLFFATGAEWKNVLITALLVVATALSIYSVINYIILAVRINKERKSGGKIVSGDDTTV